MRLVTRLLNRISLTRKILIIFIGCVCVPFAMLFVFYFTQTQKNIEAEISQRMTNTLDDIAASIEAEIDDAVRLSVKYSNDMRVYQCLDRNYQSDIEYLIDYQDSISQTVRNDLPIHLQIESISFTTNNPTVFSGALVQQRAPISSRRQGETLQEETAFFSGSGGDFSSLRVGLRRVTHKKIDRRSLSLVRPLIYYPEYSRYVKYLTVDLNISYFNAYLSDTALFGNLLLVDGEGRILLSSNTYSQTGSFEYFSPAQLPDGLLLLERGLRQFPLTLYGYYDEGLVSDEFELSILNMLALMTASMAIAVGFILIIGTNISKRTQGVVRKAEQIAKGDFSDQIVYIAEDGADELARIEKSVNQLSVRLKELIDREYRAELAKSRLEKETAQAKLMALQSQVNPHFLFNALESIRLNALDKDREETVSMIWHMSRMFRYLVDWDGDMVSLEDELKFLDKYLTIQKYRFGSEFSYDIEVDGRAREARVPKLILQPLVENACVHGVEATDNRKHIRIQVFLEAGGLVMKVTDNGGGIPAGTLSSIRAMLSGGAVSEKSVGLYNISQRLTLHYGELYGFEIDSEPGKGTVCSVRIPV